MFFFCFMIVLRWSQHDGHAQITSPLFMTPLMSDILKFVHLEQYHTPQIEHSISPAVLGSLLKFCRMQHMPVELFYQPCYSGLTGWQLEIWFPRHCLHWQPGWRHCPRPREPSCRHLGGSWRPGRRHGPTYDTYSVINLIASMIHHQTL